MMAFVYKTVEKQKEKALRLVIKIPLSARKVFPLSAVDDGHK